MTVPTPAANALREAVERLFGWMDSRPAEHALYADLRTIVDAALAAVPAVRERDAGFVVQVDQRLNKPTHVRIERPAGVPIVDGYVLPHDPTAVRERDDQAGERVSCVCGGPLIDGGAGEWMHANGDDARFGHRGHPATDDQAGEVVNDRYAHDTAGCCGDGENAWPTPCPTHGVTRPAEDGEPR